MYLGTQAGASGRTALRKGTSCGGLAFAKPSTSGLGAENLRVRTQPHAWGAFGLHQGALLPCCQWAQEVECAAARLCSCFAQFPDGSKDVAVEP